MKTGAKFIGAATIVLALAGCAVHSDPSSPGQQPVSTAAATPTAASTPVSTTDTKDAAFVQAVRATSPDIGYTDGELVAYGVIACAQLTSGSDRTNIRVLPESDPAMLDHNSTVVGAAQQILCP